METEFLAYLELRQDLLFEKIPTDKINYYIDKSIEIGKRTAIQYYNKKLEEIINENNVVVEKIDGDGKLFNMKLRAQIEFDPKGKNKIFLYSDSINEYANTCNISIEDAQKIHIAHELFHLHEFKTNEEVSSLLDKIETINILGFKRYAGILRTSEIAAHAFARELLDLSVLPNYYDFLYSVRNGKISQHDVNDLKDEFNSLVKK